MPRSPISRRMAVGADVQRGGGVNFRVWAPDHQRVAVVLEEADGRSRTEHALEAEASGYFAATIAPAEAGTRYFYRLDDAEPLSPDPASRFQPAGPHGPSQVIDPEQFTWSDQAWRGVTDGHIVYEMHVGTFTRAGTWTAAIEHLAGLASLGITTIEIMPVSEFAGCYGWGYDGVDLYAPTHHYGEPDDFRRFVNAAHGLGLGVVLDVVYNHLGPDGNFLDRFARRYFSSRRTTDWGAALNFDEDAAGVREFVAGNAAYWVDEFHLDGLRFDATQQIFDDSGEHILAEAARRARAVTSRPLFLVAENETQHVRLIKSTADGGFGIDALWNDDFHHAARVRLTGRREAYYTDYTGSAQELLSLTKWGFLFQGQRYTWQKAPRGTPTFGIRPTQFVTFLENHDQVANAPSGSGERLHQISDAGNYRAMTAFWLLSPGTPMLFQGQEFGSTAPFLYFADHHGELARAVRTGRAEFMTQFRSLASRDPASVVPDPCERSTFDRCLLSDEERQQHGPVYALHRDLLRVRREDAAFRLAGRGWFDGAVLGQDSLVLRFFSADPRDRSGASATFRDDRLVVVNFGADDVVNPVSEPLFAPPLDAEWSLRWSSEDAAYGGAGTPRMETSGGLRIPGHAAVVLAPRAP